MQQSRRGRLHDQHTQGALHFRQSAENSYDTAVIMSASAQERFDAEGRLSDEITGEFIAKLVTALGDRTRKLQAGSQR